MKLFPFQDRALRHLFEAPTKHLVVLAPTGSGKSKIYELWADRRRAMKLPVRMILLTPLVALAEQQKLQLTRLGFRVARALRDLEYGADCLVLSPESLSYDGAFDRLRAWNPAMLVVDECHCVWEWGQSFRPAYQVTSALLRLPTLERTLWMTATLSHASLSELGTWTRGDLEVHGGFALPANLVARTMELPWPRRSAWVRARIGVPHRDHGIVLFVASRRMTERLSRMLGDLTPFHAGMSREERSAIQGRLQSEREWADSVLVATTAFGLGVHADSLGEAILWQPLPRLVDNLQALGRVGRGGRSGVATLLWDTWDIEELKRRSDESTDWLTERNACWPKRLERHLVLEPEWKPCGRCYRCCSG